jgi:hypothetical protein
MAHGFSQYDLRDFAVAYRQGCWANDHLGSHDTQAIGFRAYRALEQYLYGKRGRPRFKRGDQFTSMEGFSNEAVIRYRDGVVHWDGLALPLIRDPRDKYHWERDALACKTKYVRIVRRRHRGRWRYYAQLVQEGKPPTCQRILAPKGTLGGLDLGPSTLAAVTDKLALKTVLCPGVANKAAELRVVGRAIDRSRRAMNPGNYNPDGTVRRGPKRWVRSNHYRKLQACQEDLQVGLAATRKREHGELANRLLAQALNWRTEDVSYKAFQRLLGRSVGRRAPSLFIATLSRKAENTGGSVVAFRTRSTRLSQFDHSTGDCVKKPLSERLHVFGDGRTAPVDRDVYSAFLARFVRDDQLDIRQVLEAWPHAEPRVRLPVSGLPSCERRALPGHGPRKGPVGAVRQSKAGSARDDAGDAVRRKAESPGKALVTAREAQASARIPRP